MMTKLIFLPIDITIPEEDYTIETGADSNWGRHTIFWNSKILTVQQAREQKLGPIMDQLPFKEITFIKYNHQARDVLPHIDLVERLNIPELSHIKENEPAGYRLVFTGSNDSLEVYDNKSWIKTTLPSVPGCYLLNSTATSHRVLNDTGRTGLYFRGVLDVVKHQDLISRSLLKYKDYAIYQTTSS